MLSPPHTAAAGAQTMRSPSPGAGGARQGAPVAQPISKQQQQQQHYATLPVAARSPPPGAAGAARVASPPLKSPSPAPVAGARLAAAASSSGKAGTATADSLASFYGAASQTADTDAGQDDEEQSGPEGQERSSAAAAAAPMTASSFYAMAAAPSPKSAVSSSSATSSAAPSRATSPPIPTLAAAPVPARSALSPPPAAAPGIPSVLQTIAAKFVCPPLDLTAAPGRVLVREGYLARQATFKNVERYCYCFNDLFIVTEPLDEGSSPAASATSPPQSVARKKLTMKQIVPLAEATLTPGKKPNIFILAQPRNPAEKSLYFECASEREAREWSDAIVAAIEQAKREQVLLPTPTAASSAAPSSLAPQTLFSAIASRDEELLLHLLDGGGGDGDVDVEQRDTMGYTPLHRAIQGGFLSAVSILLSSGAEISTATAREGKSSLHLAALHDQYAIFLLLLSRKPAFDVIVDEDGRSALWDLVQGPYGHAAGEEQPQGAPGSSLNKKGRRRRGRSHHAYPAAAAAAATTMSPQNAAAAFAAAAASGTLEQVHAEQVNNEDFAGASDEEDDEEESDEKSDDEEEEESDAPSGAASPASPLSSPSSGGTDHETRLSETLAKNRWADLVECVRVLSEAGIDLEQRDRQGKTLVMHLAATAQVESLEILLDVGASLSSIHTASGATALHYAVCPLLSGGFVEASSLARVVRCITLLLQRGLCPNLRDHDLRTALHLAKSLPLACCLLVHGARPDLKDSEGRRAVQWFEDQASKGGDDLASISSQMREAREAWSQRKDTVLPRGETLDPQGGNWLDNELSDCCLLCQTAFSFTMRRHHCRRCGMLVCSSCSSKKFSTPSGRETGLRSCDPCFNIMASRAVIEARQVRRAALKRREEAAERDKERRELDAAFDASHKAFVAQRKREEERIAAKLKRIEDIKANPDKPVPPPPVIKRSKPAGAASASGSKNDPAASVAAKSTSTQQQMSQNVRLAQERGEKLGMMEDKAARMEADAENFADMARKLKEKHKSSWF